MKLLICMDDTDNLDSIGTGQLLENLCGHLVLLLGGELSTPARPIYGTTHVVRAVPPHDLV